MMLETTHQLVEVAKIDQFCYMGWEINFLIFLRKKKKEKKI